MVLVVFIVVAFQRIAGQFVRRFLYRFFGLAFLNTEPFSNYEKGFRREMIALGTQ